MEKTRLFIAKLFVVLMLGSVALFGGKSNAQVIENNPVKAGEIFVIGNIEENFTKRLRDHLNANPSRKTIVLTSDGGLVYEAATAADLIRARGLNTQIENNEGCLSACSILWLAGKVRYMSEGGRLGLHSPALSDAELYHRMPVSELRAMFDFARSVMIKHGATPAMIVIMESTPPASMTFLSRSQLAELGIKGIVYI